VGAPFLSDFINHLDESFEVSSDAIRATLKLIEATELKPLGAGLAVPFSLIFEGPRAPQLAQGTYEFAHPQVGTMPIFIVPIGLTEHGVQYQAIFS
jgi:hypothetical protein